MFVVRSPHAIAHDAVNHPLSQVHCPLVHSPCPLQSYGQGSVGALVLGCVAVLGGLGTGVNGARLGCSVRREGDGVGSNDGRAEGRGDGGLVVGAREGCPDGACVVGNAVLGAELVGTADGKAVVGAEEGNGVVGTGEVGVTDGAAVEGAPVGVFVVGIAEGSRLGALDGAGVGSAVGEAVGRNDGAAVGRTVGLLLGALEGALVGDSDGPGVGLLDGPTVGTEEGALEGAEDGALEEGALEGAEDGADRTADSLSALIRGTVAFKVTTGSRDAKTAAWVGVSDGTGVVDGTGVLARVGVLDGKAEGMEVGTGVTGIDGVWLGMCDGAWLGGTLDGTWLGSPDGLAELGLAVGLDDGLRVGAFVLVGEADGTTVEGIVEGGQVGGSREISTTPNDLPPAATVESAPRLQSVCNCSTRACPSTLLPEIVSSRTVEPPYKTIRNTSALKVEIGCKCCTNAVTIESTEGQTISTAASRVTYAVPIVVRRGMWLGALELEGGTRAGGSVEGTTLARAATSPSDGAKVSAASTLATLGSPTACWPGPAAVLEAGEDGSRGVLDGASVGRSAPLLGACAREEGCGLGDSVTNATGAYVGDADGRLVRNDGAALGALDGRTDGRAVGESVRVGVGAVEGDRLGRLVGRPDGRPVGEALGAAEGELLGAAEGERLGRLEGRSEGELLGAWDGDGEGSELGGAVGEALGALVGDSVHTAATHVFAWLRLEADGQLTPPAIASSSRYRFRDLLPSPQGWSHSPQASHSLRAQSTGQSGELHTTL